jgi:PAS domain S-box-containing protein
VGAGIDAERALRASMDGLSGIAVFLLEPDSTVIDCYGAALARHGYQRAAMIGRRLADALPDGVWRHIAPLIENALAGTSVTERVSYDRTTEYEVTVTAIREEGRIVGVTLSTREISELRATERELAETARRFQALAETSVEGHCRYGPTAPCCGRRRACVRCSAAISTMRSAPRSNRWCIPTTRASATKPWRRC